MTDRRATLGPRWLVRAKQRFRERISRHGSRPSRLDVEGLRAQLFAGGESYTYPREYFVGGKVSGYVDYAGVREIVETLAVMLNDLFHPISVLDCGAAYGFVPDWFGARGVPACGVDISAFACSKSVRMIQADIRDIPIRDMSFDLVVSSACIEHVPPEDVATALAEFARASSHFICVLTPFEGDEDCYGDPTHLTIKPEAWWDAQWQAALATGRKATWSRRADIENALSDWCRPAEAIPFAQRMDWAHRFRVFERIRTP